MGAYAYVSPQSVADCIAVLSEHARSGDRVQVLAGGTDLMVQIRSVDNSPRTIVDIKKIAETNRLDIGADEIYIGSAIPSAALFENDELKSKLPGLIEASDLIGSTQIQGRATIGGNLCNASPAGDSIPAMIAVGAVCDIANADGGRQLPVEEFVTGVGQNALEDGEFLHRHAKHNQSEPVAGFIGKTDSSEARATAFRKIIAAGLSTPNLLDPEATIESHVKMGCGVHVLSGATIAVGSELGNDVLVNHRAVVEHDAVIGDHVHIATGALLCGGVSIGKRCLIGAGAIVLPGRKIAAGSVVGAGSVVIQDVAPDTVVAGNPAKQIRCLSPVQVTHCGVA